jgi:hypothetical protein
MTANDNAKVIPFPVRIRQEYDGIPEEFPEVPLMRALKDETIEDVFIIASHRDGTMSYSSNDLPECVANLWLDMAKRTLLNSQME